MRISLFLLLIFLAGPFLAPFDTMDADPARQLTGPGPIHLQGTDLLGRDVFSRVLHAGQRTVITAGAVTGIVMFNALAIALTVRLIRRGDRLIAATLDALMAIPGLMLALVLITAIGQGTMSLILAVSLAQIAPAAHVLRAALMGVEHAGFIEAAHSLGARRSQIITEHLLPAIRPIILSYGGVIFSYAALNIALLGFLGVGGEPGVPDLGGMLAENRSIFRLVPWTSIAPGVMLTMLVWAINRSADAIATLHQPA